MSILVNADTRLLVQGITGREGAFHSTAMLEYGTDIVAGREVIQVANCVEITGWHEQSLNGRAQTDASETGIKSE